MNIGVERLDLQPIMSRLWERVRSRLPLSFPRSAKWTARGLSRFDRDRAAETAPTLVADDAGHLGEERVVLPAAHVGARKKLRAPLPDQDGASRHVLAAERLDAEALGVRVATVAGRALSFFVCHGFAFDPSTLRSLRCGLRSSSGDDP